MSDTTDRIPRTILPIPERQLFKAGRETARADEQHGTECTAPRFSAAMSFAAADDEDWLLGRVGDRSYELLISSHRPLGLADAATPHQHNRSVGNRGLGIDRTRRPAMDTDGWKPEPNAIGHRTSSVPRLS
jgi:hypothetical protein